MKKTFCFLFTALLFLLSLTGCEQTASEPLLQELPPQKGEDIAVMETSLGTIKLRFFPEQAPMAVENFLTLAKEGYYDGVSFHRVMSDFMIQGGDPTGTDVYKRQPVHNCVMVVIEHRTSQNKEGTVWLLQISGKTEYGRSP